MNCQSPQTPPLSLPESVQSIDELELLLSRPGEKLVRSIREISSPLVIVGAGGKLGPTLAVMARRAAEAAGHTLDVVAVSRFGSAASARDRLEKSGVRAISCDVLRRDSLDSLPDSENVIHLVGQKFGTSKSPSATWAVNVLPAAHVAQRYSQARIAALSTGNVYPQSQASGRGSLESDPLTPLGEYANSTVARERILEFYSLAEHIRMALVRLCYAVELRYGVLLDIARKVHAGESIDLANGFFNCIWQGDANEMILRCLALSDSPPTAWNLCRPEVFSVRAVAADFGELLGRPPQFTGAESSSALLCDSRALCARLGEPPTPLEPMLRLIADWVRRGGCTLGKPTGFEVRDGRY
jgi:nucleoside-diphosphate-sugar epimerase